MPSRTIINQRAIPYGGGRPRRSPELLTITGHGLTDVSVQWPRPIAVNLSNAHVVATTNDQATQSFAGTAVQVIDANTLGWFPIAAFKDAGKRTTGGGTLTTGETYWLQTDGSVGTALPGSGAQIPVFRAESTTTYDLDGDFWADVSTTGTANTNIATTSLTQDADRTYTMAGFIQSVIGETWHWIDGFRMNDTSDSGPWQINLTDTGRLQTDLGGSTVEHVAKVTQFLSLTPAAAVGGSFAWTDNQPVYISALTSNQTLPTPTNLTNGEWLDVYLQGNSSGFVWDLSAFDFGENNDDGSSFVPVQSTVTTKMDRMTVHRVGSAYTGVWHRGMTNSTP